MIWYALINILPYKYKLPIPVFRALRKLGSDICDARKRRRITMQLMADRAGLARTTISKVEKGDPTASMGSYDTVLFILGMLDRLSDLVDASHDVTGIQLIDEQLPKRVRTRSSFKKGGDYDG